MKDDIFTSELGKEGPPNLSPVKGAPTANWLFISLYPVVLWGLKRGQQGINEKGVAKTNSRVLAHVALAV